MRLSYVDVKVYIAILFGICDLISGGVDMYYIYRITNKLTGKTYIGQHKYTNLAKDKYLGSGKYLWNAIHKYGIENFEKEILISEIETKEEINELEKEYIRLERESGHGEYNITDGGEGWNLSGENHPLYGKHLSNETKDKISKAHKGNTYFSGKHHTLEFKKMMSENYLGNGNPFYGKHHSKETRLKYLESRKGENHPLYGKQRSEDTKKKISNSVIKSRLGKRFYNNGIECHLYTPGTEPKGYMLGKLK